jgi:hypothetical protein
MGTGTIRKILKKRCIIVKVFLVMVLLSAAMLLLVILLDLAMHFPLSGIVQKELTPFKVTEETEVIFFVIIALYFVIKAIVGIVKKRQQSNPY